MKLVKEWKRASCFMVMSPKNNYVARAKAGGVHLYVRRTGEKVAVLSHPKNPGSVAFSADEKYIAIKDTRRCLCVYRIKDGALVYRNIKYHKTACDIYDHAICFIDESHVVFEVGAESLISHDLPQKKTIELLLKPNHGTFSYSKLLGEHFTIVQEVLDARDEDEYNLCKIDCINKSLIPLSSTISYGVCIGIVAKQTFCFEIIGYVSECNAKNIIEDSRLLFNFRHFIADITPLIDKNFLLARNLATQSLHCLCADSAIVRIQGSPLGNYICAWVHETIIVWDINADKHIATFPVKYSSLSSITFSDDEKYLLISNGVSDQIWEL
jgi:WD40 repeat protein